MESAPKSHYNLYKKWSEIRHQNFDFENVNNIHMKMERIKPLLEGKPIIFSDTIDKINQYQWNQKRLLIITEDYIYNIHNYKLKRKMPISSLEGITQNTLGKRLEFTLHFKNEYDYRFHSYRRAIIIKILKCLFGFQMGTNLPIYGINEENLKQYTTTEKDVSKGISRIPLQLARLYYEDLILVNSAGQPILSEEEKKIEYITPKAVQTPFNESNIGQTVDIEDKQTPEESKAMYDNPQDYQNIEDFFDDHQGLLDGQPVKPTMDGTPDKSNG